VLESAVVGLDAVVGVALDVMPRRAYPEPRRGQLRLRA
jgi:hypothetical protein